MGTITRIDQENCPQEAEHYHAEMTPATVVAVGGGRMRIEVFNAGRKISFMMTEKNALRLAEEIRKEAGGASNA